MAIRERNNLKTWFQTGKYPTQDQFWDWIDSFVHKSEDKVDIDSIARLRSLLDNKADSGSIPGTVPAGAGAGGAPDRK